MAIEWTVHTFDMLSGAQLYAALKLRQDIFVVEQDCAYPDLDNLDQQALHMLGRENGELLAYQRCLPPGVSYRESAIGRIVVSQAARGRSLGRELVQRGIDFNEQQWPDHAIRIGAQSHLQAFYASLGFVTVGKEYVEDGIPHVHMLKTPTGK